jgi:hypothetical protein
MYLVTPTIPALQLALLIQAATPPSYDHRHFQVWHKLEATDLDAAYPSLALRYSADQGRIARHPVCMFRPFIYRDRL